MPTAALLSRPHTTPMARVRERKAQQHHRQQGDQEHVLCFGDILQQADRERATASRQGLRAAAAQAATRAGYGQEPQRPHTTAGRPSLMTPPPRRPVTKVVFGDPAPARPATPSTDIMLWGVSECDKPPGIPSKQTCEVLGPGSCSSCRRLRVRQDDLNKCEQAFPALYANEESFTTTARMRKHFPGRSEQEIRQMMNRGEINHQTLREQMTSAKQKRHYNVSLRPKTDQDLRKPKVTSDDGVTITFFTDLVQLNERIIKGKADRHVGFTKIDELLNPNFSVVDSPAKSRSSFLTTNALFPAFISMRKPRPQTPGSKAHFDPPLIPKSQQKSQPSFFAGTETKYELPEKLPDKIISDDVQAAIEKELQTARENDQSENIVPGSFAVGQVEAPTSC